MFSIGRFAKLADVSPRAVRHYEAVGLLVSTSRGANNYRQYASSQLEQIRKIRNLQGLGFSLKEIQKILTISPEDLSERLQERLDQLDGEIDSLRLRRNELERLLSISNKIDLQKQIDDTERQQYMSAVRTELLSGLQSKIGAVSNAQLGYVDRDDRFYSDPAKAEMLYAIKKCVEFARARGLTLGPGRGSSPASIALFALGLGQIDPSRYDLIPERLRSTVSMDIHIDVEFARGQDFVDYCREVSASLEHGEINAFKMPLIDIIQNVHAKLGRPVPYGAIPDDSDLVLKHFRSGEIDKIFGFDLSPHALIMKYENLLPEFLGTSRISEYLKSQKIRNFRDVVNISALWRPYREEIVSRLERYREAKLHPHSYNFLSPALQESLKPNFGLVVYHEDLIRIIQEATGWELAECNELRRGLNMAPNEPATLEQLAAFKSLASPEVVALVISEGPWAFCQPHAIAFSVFTKQTAILKSLHRDLYLGEIAEWEQANGFTWDDIGIKLKGVSLLQT